MGSGKRFAVLMCAEASDYVKKKYGGYDGVFVEMLAEEGETWDVFMVVNGEFPDDEQIEQLDGFVITGSCNDAHGNDDWICRLISLLKQLDSLNKKVLGICFGHQVLSRALGGKTGRATSGWDIGITNIHFSSSSSELFSFLEIPTTLSIIECHRDEVRELPPEAEVIAWSEKTGVEMFRYGDHMMGIQGHPEYTKDILLHLIDRLVQREYIAESYADELKAKLGKVEPDKDAWKKLCTNFLKGRLPSRPKHARRRDTNRVADANRDALAKKSYLVAEDSCTFDQPSADVASLLIEDQRATPFSCNIL